MAGSSIIEGTPKRRVACWRLRWCWRVGHGRPWRKPAPWIGRLCATGVHRYNADGLEGLFNQPRRNGPPPRLSAAQLAKMAEWVEHGPDFDRHGVVRWRCVDLQQRIREEFLVELHESTVGKLLRQIVVPAHVGASAASAQQAG